MEVSIIRIGNSKGIRLSKSLIKQYNLKDKVEMVLEKEHILIKPMPDVRKDWESAFEEMHKHGDDQLLIEDIFDDENLEEWK